MHFLVIQHLSIEPPGVIGEVILARGHTLHTVQVGEGEALPGHPHAYDGLVIMGGPESANDDHLPHIRAELALLQAALADDMPVIGVCLGAQLLARAAGGAILPSPRRELGWYTLAGTKTAACDPLFSDMAGREAVVFQWHGETFSLPAGAELLATASDVRHQAFRIGTGQYGLQFHIEVDAATIATWIAAGESERRHLGTTGVTAIHRDMPHYLPAMQAWCRRMTMQWLVLAGERSEKR